MKVAEVVSVLEAVVDKVEEGLVVGVVTSQF